VKKFGAVSAMLFTVTVLTLSDRAPRWIGAAQHGVGRAVLDAFAINDAPTLRFAGQHLDPGHLVIWAIVAFVAVILVRKLWQAALVTALLIAASATLEYAQDFVTSSRNSDLGDLYSNLIGIGIGAVGGTILTIGALAVRPSRTP
jgi:K+-sensing histidine kinase KdpD